MLCVVQLSAYRVGEEFDIAEWLKLNGVSYYCINQTYDTVVIPDFATSLIISGAPLESRFSDHIVDILRGLSLPVFGICFGCMAIVRAHGGTLTDATREPTLVNVHGDLLGFSGRSTAVAAHRERIETLGELASCLWDLDTHEVLGVQHPKRPIYGVMFHPESPQTQCGSALLQAFLQRS